MNKTFNKNFTEDAEALDTSECPSNNKGSLNEQLTAIVIKFQDYPSIMKIKSII